MNELLLSSIERIYYRPSDKAQKLILEKLKEKRRSNPRLSMNALIDEIVISHLDEGL